MRITSLFALALIALCFAWTYGDGTEGTADLTPGDTSDLRQRITVATRDALEFDLVQRTCAMYVAVRSIALETPIAFDRDMADIPVHWNMCPGGTMVACADGPAANADTTHVGIPWPY